MSQPTRKGIDWSFSGTQPHDSALQYFWSRKKWDYGRVVALLLATLSLAIPLFVIYRGYFATMNTRDERSLIIVLLLLFAFLRFPLGRRRWNQRPGWPFLLDILLILSAIANEAYIIWGEAIGDTRDVHLTVFGQSVRWDYIMAWTLLLSILEATRRSFGWIMVLVPVFFIFYAMTANLWPGPLLGARAEPSYFAGMLYLQDTGMFGIGVQVLLSMVFPFLIFGSFVVSTKVGAFFTAFANALVGRYSGGPAKVAVVASALFGTVSGSAVANVATTGCITIPMMKNLGYKPAFAGAVETCASSGGYFTPPVMGAAAFLIASFANIPYLTVCLYAALPASLYYLAVFIQVHARAKRSVLSGLAVDMIPSLSRVLVEGGYLVLPAVFLIVALAMGYSITLVAIIGTAGVLLVSFFSKNTRQSPREVLVMLETATSSTIGVSLAVVVTGIVEGAVTVSGLGTRLSLLVEVLSGGHLVVGLLIAAVVLMILGMGVNPLLVYYMGYLFMLPALVKLGALAMPLHIFMLIYGGLASITPPVAVAAFTAANIAQASPMRTAFEAVKLGFAAYIVPFMLVLQPALLFLGGTTVFDTVAAIATATLGISCMAVSFEGWLFRDLTRWERTLIFIAGLCQISSSMALSIAGLVLAALMTAWTYLAAHRVPVHRTAA